MLSISTCGTTPGRPGCSHACGALLKMKPLFKEYKDGKCDIHKKGTHEFLDPEQSIMVWRCGFSRWNLS